MEKQIATKFFIKRQRRKRRRLIQTFVLILITVVAVGFVFMFFRGISGKSGGLVNPFVSSGSNLNSPNGVNPPEAENQIEKAVKNALVDTKGDYAVAIKNLKTGESYFLNEKKIYETGSLYKLWVMATAYQQIQEGILTKDEILSDSVRNLNQKFNIGPADAEMTSGAFSMSVASAIKQMITISHNYAAMLLTDKVKSSSVEIFLKSNIFSSSALREGVEAPSSNAFDIMLFFEKLYKGELANPEDTTEMLEILKGQQSDGGLPKYLPPTTIVANKTGDIGWFKHDAGIVYTEKGDYIIVVMSKSDSPAGAQDRIALISKAVYEYFNK
ncbi:MAG: serine hydrolase [Microgenomates group bacterium]|jgi:beta-lactamase class A